MKVAIVYDRVNKWGGAERVLLALHRIYPDAPLYTSLYHPNKARWASVFQVKTTFLQRMRFLRDKHELLGICMPIGFETLDFSGYDLVISVTSEAAKGIITPPGTKHICICLTPTRYLWQDYDTYFTGSFFRFITRPIISYLRTWDTVAIRRPDLVLSISNVVKKRVQRYYGVESSLLYPPSSSLVDEVDIAYPPEKDYFLVVSRLVPYKRIDIVVRVATALNLPLIVIGKGVEKRHLRSIAGNTVKFKEYVSDELLRGYYAHAKAFIYPAKEDFGIAMVEAQLHGTPVIAYRRGAAQEIVIEGKTGTLFGAQTAHSLQEKLKTFQQDTYNKKDCRENAKRFSDRVFEKQLRKYVQEILQI